jgi:hypothetical protein
MGRRLELHQILTDVLGSKNVYFQPPASVKLVYPCIIYRYETGDTQFADDLPYIFVRKYQIQVIDPNPDTEIPDKIAQLPRCLNDRNYTADNLNHYTFNIYY